MQITQIKSRLSILAVLNHYNHVPDNNQMLCCPFHQDKTPSMQVYPNTNTVFCFSSNCKLGGKAIDQIDFIKFKENCTKHEAIMKAKRLIGVSQLAGVTTSSNGQSTKDNQKQLPLQPQGEEQPDYEAVFAQMQSSLLSSSVARKYLKSRGLNPDKVDVGYNAFKSSRYNYLRGCVTFGLRDGDGKVVSLYGRSVRANDKARHYYTANRRGMYPGYPKVKTKRLILCESVVDGATLQSAGKINKAENEALLVVYGTNGFNGEHEQIITRLEYLEEVVLFFDGDEAGQKGAGKIAQTIYAIRKEIIVKIVQTPSGEDVNSLLDGHEPKVLGHLLQGAKVFERTEDLITTESTSPRTPSKTTPTIFSSLEKHEKVSVEISVEKERARESNTTPPIKPGTLNSVNPYKISYRTATAKYYIKGGIRKDLDALKVTLVIEHLTSGHKSRNKLDLYEDKQTEKLSRDAAEKLGLRGDLVLGDLGMLTDLLEDYREAKSQEEKQKPLVQTRAERAEYYRFGQSADLMKRINTLIGKAGIVGEEKSRLFLFCAAVSHKMEKPLNIVVQGGAGSGKSHLLKVISYLVPQEKVKRYTRLSEKSFYNFGEYDLCNRLLIIEDYDGMNEEVEYALRELQSSGTLVSAVSGKEFEHSDIQTRDKIVRGPIASMVATTKGGIYHDNSTRVFFMAIDEGAEQTARIIDYKNRKSNGEVLEKTEQQARNYLQGFVRTLNTYKVKNPYLKHITLPVPHDQLRRLHELLEAFCSQITLLHQHQRKKAMGEVYIIAEKQDMQVAIELLFDSIILKVDELDGRLREFYEILKRYVSQKSKEYEFIQREIRHELHLSKSQLQRYINDLEELEYIDRRGRGHHGAIKYRIIYWDDNVALREKIKSDLETQLKKL